MNVDNEKIKSIIVKSVLGTLTEEENFVLEGWLQENDRNKVLYQKLSSAVELKYKYEQYEGVDVAEAFRRNQRRLRQDVPNRMMKKLLPYAATVLLLFSGAFCFLMNRSGEVREEVPVALSAGGKYAELILANGQKVDLHEGMEIKLRERNSNIQVKGNVVYYHKKKDSVMVEEYNMIRTPLGGEFSLTLADGTKVWLNAMSELRYPVAFGGDTREVELKGEAYFEVTKDEEHPFVVRTHLGEVTVLGTAFNLNAYRDASVCYTTLVYGKVSFSTPEDKTITLLPGEQAVISASELSKRSVNVDEYVGWVNGVYSFNNRTLGEIMQTFERWYDIQVYYETPDLRDIAYSGSVERYRAINTFLDALELTGDIYYKINGKRILIYKNE